MFLYQESRLNTMNIESASKFSKSKINKSINIVNLILISISVFLLLFWLFTIFIFVVTSMWRPQPKQIRNPLDRLNGVTLLDENIISIDRLEDDHLFYSIKNNVFLSDDLTIRNNFKENYESITIDNELVTFNEEGVLVISKGKHEIVFNISIYLVTEKYNNYEAVVINVDKDDIVTLSSEFREDDLNNRDTDRLVIYTKDSVGNYVYPIKRVPIYRTVIISYWVSVVFTSLNFIKIIILFIINRGNNKTIKKRET